MVDEAQSYQNPQQRSKKFEFELDEDSPLVPSGEPKNRGCIDKLKYVYYIYYKRDKLIVERQQNKGTKITTYSIY